MIGIGLGIGLADEVGTGGGGVENIATLGAVSDIFVPYNTAFGTNGAGVGLPASLSCTFDSAGVGSVDMTWAVGSYLPATSGASGLDDVLYVITGTPVTTGSITNTNTILKNVNVTVRDMFQPLTAGIGWIVSSSGLATSTTNTFGTVDGSNNITLLKSLAPGPLGRDLTGIGTVPTLSGGNMVFGGAGNFEQSSANTDFDFLSYDAADNVKHTILMVFNPTDTNSNNNPLMGNNGFTTSINGFSLWWDCSSTNSLVGYWIAANGAECVGWTGGSTQITAATDNVYAWQFDKTLPATSGNRVKGFRGSTQFDGSCNGSGASDITPANGKFQLGGRGGGAGGFFTGNMRMVVILTGTESDAVRNKLAADMLVYCGL